MMGLALFDMEEFALMVLASSWIAGTLARRQTKPLARGDSFADYAGAAALSALSFNAGGALFSRPVWLRAASRAAAAKGCDVRVFGIWRGAQLRKSLAVRIERKGGLALAFPVVDPLAQYTELQGSGDGEVLLDHVLRQLRSTTDAQALVLSRVRSDGPLARALAGSGAVKLRCGRAPYIDLTRHASHAAWLDSFGAATRKSRARRRKKFEAAGKTGFMVLSAGREAAETATRLIEFKRRWLQANGLSSRVLDDPAWTEALIEIVAAPDSSCVVSCLTLDGELVAGEVGFVSDDAYASYLGAYDVDQARLGVGTLQIIETVRWCYDNGIRTFDLLPPADDYKLQWTTPGCHHEVADYVVPLHKLGSFGASILSRLRLSGPMLRAIARQFG